MGFNIRLNSAAFAGNLPYTTFWTQAFGGSLHYEWQSNWRAFLVDEETGVRTTLWGDTFTPWGWGKLSGWTTRDADGAGLSSVWAGNLWQGGGMALQDLLATIAAVRDGDLDALLDLMTAPPSGVSYFPRLTPATLPGVPDGVALMPVKITVLGNGTWGGPPDPAQDDVIVTGPVRGSTIDGRSGNDRIETDGDDDSFHTVWGGGGNDTIVAGGGRHLVGAGQGDDLIDARGATAGSRLGGGTGNDTILAGAGAEIWGGPRLPGAAAPTAGVDDDVIIGETGDLLIWAGHGNDTVTGGSGNDRLILGTGNDVGHGGDGDDTLIPGRGFDVLTGGAGADVFVIRHLSGRNRIEDFSAAEVDRLFLGRGLWEPWLGALTAAEVVETFGRIVNGRNAVLDFGRADAVVVLVGVTTLDGLEDALLLV